MPRGEVMSDEKDSAGWISMADVLMLTTILLIATSYGTARFASGQQKIATERGKRLSLLEAAEQRIVVLENEKKELEWQRIELESRKEELEKSLVDVDKQNEQLKQEVGELRGAADELKKTLASEKQLAQTRDRLQREMDDVRQQLKQVSEDLSVTRKELIGAQSRSTKLQQELDAAHVAESKLKKERDSERDLASKLKAELAVAEKAKFDLEKERQKYRELAMSAVAIEDELRDEVKTQTDAANHFKGLLQKQNDRIIKPLETARVVVRARTENLRGDLDLDIYVQDPDDNICYWKEPRVLTKYAERATLIPSEDLRFANLLEQQSTQSVTEETYYASTPLTKSPYLVFCMIRHTKQVSEYESVSQKVAWEITIKNDSHQPQILNGERVIMRTGALEVREQDGRVSEIHQGLFPLTGFQVIDPALPQARTLRDGELPAQPRGWNSVNGRGRLYVRLRDG